jgi:hypothetical protein
MALKPIVIAQIRGRDGSRAPIFVPDDLCCDAVNVDFWEGGLCNRRGGCTSVSLTFSSNGPFANGLGFLGRYVPGLDESAAEFWAADGSLQIGRLAGAATWTEPTIVDAPGTVGAVLNMTAAGLGGFYFLQYDSSQNRGHVFDVALAKIRRTGLATPAVPTTATSGGSGLTFTRHYRVRYLDILGTDTRRMSEPSPSDDISITDDSGVTVTKPAAISEDETHWRVEYAESADGPWYVASGNIVVATTTYSDTDALVDTATLSEEDGQFTPPASFMYVVPGGGRLLFARPLETSGGYMLPTNNEVWWSAVLGSTDIGDLERIPPTFRVSLDHAVNGGLSEAVNGVHYAFGERAYSALVPTNQPGENAFQRITESTAIGCLHHRTLVMAEDEVGRVALYWLSHRGPYRKGAGGEQYLGTEIEDVWARVNFAADVVAHGVYYVTKHQVWWWIAVDGSAQPNERIVFDTRLGRFVQGAEEAGVTGGWVRHTGVSTMATCSAMFGSSLGASMGRSLVPYVASSTATALFRCDTGTDDNGTDYQGYLDTKEYAPAGLGSTCAILQPVIVGEASASKSVSITARTDFGKATHVSGAVSLAAEGSETHVRRRVLGIQTSGITTVRFRIGDDAATDPGFGVLDAVLVDVEPGSRI